MAPGVTRVDSCGADPVSFAAAAEGEGLTVDHAEPEGWIVWAPGETLTEVHPPGNSVRVVTLVAAALEGQPLPHLVARRAARVSTTLREWVAGWPLAGLLRPFLAPDAVGARSCNATLSGNTEWTFVSGTAAAAGDLTGGRKRELTVTFLGCGFFPIMPATLASAVLIPPALGIHFLLGSVAFQSFWFCVAVVASIVSVALERWAGRWFLAEDPREFVLDEVAGMAFAWALLPASAGWGMILLAFFLFRIFDIFKWGVSWIETLPVRGKIVWDDLLAGLYAGLACILLGLLLGLG